MIQLKFIEQIKPARKRNRYFAGIVAGEYYIHKEGGYTCHFSLMTHLSVRRWEIINKVKGYVKNHR